MTIVTIKMTILIFILVLIKYIIESREGRLIMRMRVDQLPRYVGMLIGALLFLMIIPTGVTMIISLPMFDIGNETVPLILNIVIVGAIVIFLGIDITTFILFLTVGRRKGLKLSCVFLFVGMLMNMLLAGMCMFFSDTTGRLACLYCLVTGMMFLISALLLSIGKVETPH